MQIGMHNKYLSDISITGQGHTGVRVPCEKYCYLWIVAEFILLAVLVVYYVLFEFSK
jgi:hypothetical protein